MSRRPNPGADRAAQNAQTLKALVKLEGNKVCADCKRNKHPRWASWNLGVFICIRCSGIHRGMGTHISRVKSVDLDAWTDEQLQSILKWGNTRANKYWEAKLAEGHVPSEAKIENFIRTKYDTKRWIMDGPMPDPATLDADDDVPLNIVQEKAKIERSASLKAAQAPQRSIQPPQPAPAQNIDLFGDFATEPPARPSSANIPAARVPAPPAGHQKQESLLGLDFFGSSQGAGIGRPSSAASNPTPATNTRGDLKNSILSLYASPPPPQSPTQPQTHVRQPSLGSAAPPPAQKQDSFGLLTDAFQGFTFSNGTKVNQPAPPKSSSAFSGLDFSSPMPAKATPAAPQMTSPPPLSGGNFFDSGPSRTSISKPTPAPTSPSTGLNFSFASKPSVPTTAPKPAISSMTTDLFADDGFNSFASAAPPTVTAAPIQPKSPPAPVPEFSSAFNLSSPSTVPKAEPPKPFRSGATTQSSSSMFDPWGGADANAWGAPEPAKPATRKVELGSVPSRITPNDISGGWGSPITSSNKTTQPTVAADEDFGGWTSAPAQTPKASGNRAGGFGASDPFDNPWG